MKRSGNAHQSASPAAHDGAGQFLSTHWTMVLAAGGDGPDQATAMEQFAHTYWYPIYAYIRRKGHQADAAEDLTQGFFEDLLATRWMAGLERRETRFSTLLLTIVNRFLIDAYRRQTQQKRGGGQDLLSINMEEGEQWYGCEPSTDESPETIFERRYAISVLNHAIECLGEEMRAAGKAKNYELLAPFLSREPDKGEYDAVAKEMGTNRNGVAVNVRRLRQEYRKFVRAELAGAKLTESEVDAELRHLVMAISGGSPSVI